VILTGKSSEQVAELLSSIPSLERELQCSIQVMRADRVFGRDHVASAFMKAVRAFANDDNVSDSITLETMIYMSGRRQIQEALAQMGVEDDTREIVCISTCDGTDAPGIARELGLEIDESILEDMQGKDADAFVSGTKKGADIKGPKVLDMVLERVSKVDILKR